MEKQPQEPKDFARAFGDALSHFLSEKGLTQSDASRRLGLEKGGKSRLNTYLHDSPKGKRPKPNAEVLYRLCTELGFQFDYNGYRISAVTVNGNRPSQAAEPAEQFVLEFTRQFDLTERRGTVSVSVKRPLGHIEVRLTLRAAS